MSIVEKLKPTLPPNFKEDLLSRFLDTMYIFAGVLSPDGLLLYANETALAAGGLRAAEVIGLHFADTYWWSHSPAVQNTLNKAIKRAAQGEQLRFDVDVRILGGQIITIDFALAPVHGPDGSVIYLIPSGMDLTQRLATEKALKESEAYLNLATESAGVGIWSLDPRSGELSWSALHKRMWGYQDHLDKLQYEDWHRIIHPDDVTGAFEQVKAALENRTPYQAEYRIIRANDGATRWMRSVGQYYYDSKTQEAYQLTGVTFDITARKTAEAEAQKIHDRYSAILANLPDGFMIFESIRDAQGEIEDFKWVYVNPAAEAIVFKTAAQLLGQRLLEIMPENRTAGLFDAYKSVVNTGQPWQNEFSYTLEGMEYFFLSRAIKIDDGFAVAFSDITTRKRFEEALEKKVEERTVELQRINQQVEQFAFVAAHDLQEPLRKIEMFSDLLAGKIPKEWGETVSGYLYKITNAATRMRNLISALLKFSVVSNQVDTPTPVNLNTVLASTFSIFEVRIKETNARFEIEQLPLIQGLEWQMDILFSNLIANSLKFTQPQVPPLIEVTTRPLTEEERHSNHLSAGTAYQVICIRDNGLGFEQEFADKVFEMFKRLHAHLKIEGTGIGLAMCLKIVQNHRGFIKAYGSPNAGAQFEIALPLAPNPNPE